MKKAKHIALAGILAGLATVSMVLEVPFPPAPWLRIDPSDIVVIYSFFIGGFPVGIAVVAIRTLLTLLLFGSDTGGVGQGVAFFASLSYVLPIYFVYRWARKLLWLGLILGVLSLTLTMTLANFFFVTPFYARLYNMGDILAMMEAGDGSYAKWVLPLYGGFNLLKGASLSVFYFLLHPFLKRSYLE